MQKSQSQGNIEEQRDFDPAREKTTAGDDRAKGGLNDGNPNIDSTPATSVQEAGRELREQTQQDKA